LFPDLDLTPCQYQHCVTLRLREQARCCCPSRPRRLSARRATEAIDYVLGSTRALGYFQTVAGQCLLTLMIAEVVDLERAAPESAARLRFAMQPGQEAVVGSEEGPEMLLTCGAKAATLQVTRAQAQP
jgi:hypothetical protein